MRPVEFSPESIIQAGQELQAAGRNITGFALRTKVGGGNPARLKQVWDEHVSSQAVTQAEPVAELPVEVADEVSAVAKALTDRLGSLAVELNDKAVKAAERRVAEVIRTAGEQREQAERELIDAAQTVDDLESRLDEAEARADVLTKKLADVQKLCQDQAIELAQARERIAVVVQESKTARDEHTAELCRLNTSIDAERDRHRDEIDQLRADLAEQKKSTQNAAAERDQIRDELATVKAKAEAADKAHQEYRRKTEVEMAEQKKRAQDAAAERDQLRAELSTVHTALVKVQAKAEAAELAHGEQRKQMVEQLSESRENLDEARKEVGVAREEAARLAGQLAAHQEQTAAILARLAKEN